MGFEVNDTTYVDGTRISSANFIAQDGRLVPCDAYSFTPKKAIDLKDYFFTLLFDPTDDPRIKDRHPITLEKLDTE